MPLGTNLTLAAAILSAAAAIGSALFAMQQAEAAKSALTTANRNSAMENIIQAHADLCLSVPEDFVYMPVSISPWAYVYYRDPKVEASLGDMNRSAREVEKKLSVFGSVMSLWLPRDQRDDWSKLSIEIAELISLRRRIPTGPNPIESLAKFDIEWHSELPCSPVV